MRLKVFKTIVAIVISVNWKTYVKKVKEVYREKCIQQHLHCSLETIIRM